MQMTAESFKTAFPGRDAKITEALYMHLVIGRSISDACRETGASRSGVYKALRAPARRARGNMETITVVCPIEHAGALRERIEKQLLIWERQDAARAEELRKNPAGFQAIGREPVERGRPPHDGANFGPYPISNSRPVAYNQSADYYGPTT